MTASQLVGASPTPSVTPAAVTCPQCQTQAPPAIEGVLASGGDWSCPRCHQNWSARRLQTVAAYARWCEERTTAGAAAAVAAGRVA
jgi:hypothetical protein